MYDVVSIIKTPFDVWKESLAGWGELLLRTTLGVVENLCPHTKKFLASLPGLKTFTKYSSAFLMMVCGRVGNIPNCPKNFSGLAFKAAFFVPTLLVVSHPVRLCRAGRTLQSSFPVVHTEYAGEYIACSVTDSSTDPQFFKTFL